MLYTPLLPEAASGTLEPRHTVVPLRVMCPHAELLLGRATGVDLEARTAAIETDAGRADRPLAGARARARRRAADRVPVPGLTEHGALLQVARRRDPSPQPRPAPARGGRRRARRRASGGGTSAFVFVGAGYAGVEALAELSDLVEDAVRYYPQLQDVPRRWVLVDAAPKILPEIPSRLGDYAAARAERARGRDPRRHDARVGRRRRGRARRRHAHPDAARSSGRPASRRTRCCASSACRSTSAGASRWTSSCACAATSTSGRSATARACRTRAASCRIRRPASTRCARRAGSRRTSRASRSRTATGCSARWRRSAATRGSPT